VLDNGQVKCWGQGLRGRLGLGDTADRGAQPGEMGDALPQVPFGTGRTVRAITAGQSHSCVILDNGQAKCWGSGSNGRSGYGGSTDRGAQPGQMGDTLPNVDLGTSRTAQAITAGFSHTCALLDNGQTKCWGFGDSGQLGYGDNTNRGELPGQMGDILPNVNLGTGRTAQAITSGDDHTCALLDTARLKCWGYGGNGQLGNGSTTANIGDQPNEMGDNHAVISLSRSIGRAALSVGLAADRRAVVEGGTITYTLSVANTGTITLTGITVHAPDVPSCARSVPSLAPRTMTTITCTSVTSGDDVPQMSNQVFVRTTQGVSLESPRVRTRVEPRVVRADGLIRAGSGAFLGDNTYNTTGTGQTAPATTTKRKAVRYTWRIQNDGNTTDRYVLRGTKGTRTFTVTYRQGTTNITPTVFAGTFTTPNLAPGATTDITVTVTPTRRARTGNTLTTTLTARSTTTSSATDTVRAITTRR
jgi:hypothetical protein